VSKQTHILTTTLHSGLSAVGRGAFYILLLNNLDKVSAGGHILEGSTKLICSLRVKLAIRYSLHVFVYFVQSQLTSLPSIHYITC
jgi:hypothetical protein